MPNFVSNRGKWSPAKEEIGLTNLSVNIIEYEGRKINPGQPFIYKGPCREALKMLHESGEEFLGTDFMHDPEFRQAVRNQGFENIEEYLKHIGYDEKKDEEKFKERTATVKAHEIPKKVKEILVMGGGKDFSGEKANDVVGGFGDQKVRKPSEVKK